MNDRQRQLAQIIVNEQLDAVADGGDFAAIAEALNAATIERSDSQRKVMDDLIDVVGPVDAAIVMATMWKAGNGEIEALKHVAQLCLAEWHNLSGVGTDVSRAGVQKLLFTLGHLDNWREGLAVEVAAIGRWKVSKLQEKKLEPSDADELRAAWKAFRLDQKITNATAAATESISTEMSPADQLAAWSAAWKAV